MRVAAILLLTIGIALIDYLSGSEIRVYPFYFLPIALAASKMGLRFAVFVSLLCAALWVISNALGGKTYSSSWIWVWNASAQLVAFLLVAFLIATLQAAMTREQESARIDLLTGLPNLRAFRERSALLIALCRRESTPLAIAFIDLDNFKQLNDSEGHAKGDAVLRRAGAVMAGSLRSTDLFCRAGGDEFLALLPKSSPEAAEETLERVRQALEAAMRSEGTEITASLGAIVYTTPPDDIDALIQAADRKMYDVKRAGKNCVSVSLVA